MLNVEQARSTFQIRRADQYPTLNLGRGRLARTRLALGDIVTTYSAGIAVSAYELDLFGRVRSLSQSSAGLLLRDGRRAPRSAQISLVSSVAIGYLNLLADDELIALSKQTVTTREDSNRLTQLRFDNGASSELDRSADAVAGRKRQGHAGRARFSQRALDQDALALLLGQPVPTDLPQGRPLESQGLLADLPPGLPSELLINRPDIRQAEQQLIAANANIGAARANFFPRISVDGAGGHRQHAGVRPVLGRHLSVDLRADRSPCRSSTRAATRPRSTLPRSGATSRSRRTRRPFNRRFGMCPMRLPGRETLLEQLRAQRAQAEAESVRFKLSDLALSEAACRAISTCSTRSARSTRCSRPRSRRRRRSCRTW